MHNNSHVWFKSDYTLRPFVPEDAETYYEQNFVTPDPEVIRLTGSRSDYTRDEVVSFFLRCIDDPDRRDFLLIAPDGRIVGESVVNEIDWDVRCANFRICIFHTADCSRGLGGWMVQTMRDYAFSQLHLHRLSLEVFSFNSRAIHVYESAGFRQEGVLRDAVLNGGTYSDIILMSMLEDEWALLNRTKKDG